MKNPENKIITGFFKPVLLAAVMLTFSSCQQNVYFSEPQPAGKSDLKSFPARIRGEYFGMNDTLKYVVLKECILQLYVEEIEQTISEIIEDDELTLEGNSIRIDGFDQDFPVVRRNDSIFGTMELFDTIINLKGSDILRKMSGQYFLNQVSDSLWIVYKLSLHKSGEAFVCDIDHSVEMDIFSKRCRVDTICVDERRKFIISPTKKELKTLLELKTFTDTIEYLRRENR
jgi:hypothetical protein